tara:strand:+ start:1022 stop:1228 length:207 start_codon:yes stop_codon:yes gene_type:complete
MKVKNLITIVDELRYISQFLADEERSWATWQESKPKTIHLIADTKCRQFESVREKVSDIQELIKEVDL